MPRDTSIKKVLVIGSGPIIIGQAAEFDYAGTQCCRALKEDNIEVVLVNSNPATIMTDKEIADRVYIEPLTIETIKQIIVKEKPDCIIGTLGGQTGLNLSMELKEDGYLDTMDVRLIGTGPYAIKKAEDRQEFKDLMESIDEPCIESLVVENVKDALDFAEKITYPVIVRPAYTMGGTGGGIAYDAGQLREIATSGIRASRVGQVLIEKCISGWKEIEFEVIRDSKGNCIVVCSMENFDPVGVHTGDSIVVAPVQTLAAKEYAMLRNSAFNIISALDIQGGCNVQYALHPDSFEYAVIEVNPRLSRSSALASKAAGYPIAKVATKIALGYTLDEIPNAVTGNTFASFEPSIDYICCKIPKWPFDKFLSAKRTLGTQMKATGEVMSISPSFEAGLMKAVRCLEMGLEGLSMPYVSALTDFELDAKLSDIDDRRLFVIAEYFRRGGNIDYVFDITKIDRFFLSKIMNIVRMEKRLQVEGYAVIYLAKELGFPDTLIARLTKLSLDDIVSYREKNGLKPGYRLVDTCAGEFPAKTPYYYSAYGVQNESNAVQDKPRVVVLGSGPIRIGQGIEFDYCSVHCVWALRKAGYEAIIINNNPETVSTDFDVADRLYFEPLTPEDVQAILEIEKPIGVMVQFGGQTAIKLAETVKNLGYKILGTPYEGVDGAEDRKVFDKILSDNNIDRPNGTTVTTPQDALTVANELGYPVLLRPSYVLGGQGMMIAFNNDEVVRWTDTIMKKESEDDVIKPILIDQYIMGLEVEIDAICDGHDILVPGIMEHLERAGVHSGDSISVYPPQRVPQSKRDILLDYTRKIALSLGVRGLINIQFILHNSKVYVIEANPRSSRTVPYISKITNLPVVEIATLAAMGKTMPELGYNYGIYHESSSVAVKLPIFSFEKLYGAEVSLGPEMKSTGEVLGLADNLPDALYKAFLGAGVRLPRTKRIIITVNDNDKEEACAIARRFSKLGYELYATKGTCEALFAHGIKANYTRKLEENDGPNITDLIREKGVDLVVNTGANSGGAKRDGFIIRRLAVEFGISCLTSLDTADALLVSLEHRKPGQLDVIDISKL